MALGFGANAKFLAAYEAAYGTPPAAENPAAAAHSKRRGIPGDPGTPKGLANLAPLGFPDAREKPECVQPPGGPVFGCASRTRYGNPGNTRLPATSRK